MKRLNSLLAAVAAATLAVCAAQTASAADVVADLGALAVPSFNVFGTTLRAGFPDSANTYIWEFQTAQSAQGLFQMVLSNTGPEALQFELDKCTGLGIGCAAVPGGTSGIATGATVPFGGGTLLIGPGDYQLKTLFLGHPLDELGSLSGSINLESAVPEPATWAMLILGIGMIGFAARRRHEVMGVAA